MGDLRKPVICTFIYTVFVLLFAFASFSEAAMPTYQRLSPITSYVYSPTAVAVDSDGNIYVTESINDKLLVYSQSKMHIKSLTGLSKPISVAADNSGRVFIGNDYNFLEGNVEVYDADLNFLFKLGTGDGEFSKPSSIAIDSSAGNIYVVDMKRDVVEVYDTDGAHAFSFDGTLNGGGQFHDPTSMVIDSGELIVLDHPLTLKQDNLGNDVWVNGARIQYFEMNGAYKNGFNKYGANMGDMRQPMHLATDNEGRIYVSDTWDNIIKVYERNGVYLGAVYNIENPLRTPLGITITSGNVLYIASLRTKKVESYGITSFAQMAIDPLSLLWEEQRGGSPSSKNVQISNNGDKSFGWTAATSSSWITLSDTFGTVGPNGSFSLNIGIDLHGLPAGNYTGSVSISAEYGAAEAISIELALQDILLIANPGGPYSVTEGQLIQLEGSSSSGAIVLYEWDIDDNGSYDYSSPLPFQNHTYAIAGTYKASLRVIDDLDATHNALVNVSVLDAIPTADFTSSSAAGDTPYTVNFTNGSTGYDQPLTYEWDFDNDEEPDSTGANPSHVYTYPGLYFVRLTVTDSDGSIISLTRTHYIDDPDGTDCADSYVKIGIFESTSLQAVYDVSNDGEIIKIRNVTISEVTEFNRDITVTLSGGYDCDYMVNEGATIINGGMTVSNGTVIIENSIILE